MQHGNRKLHRNVSTFPACLLTMILMGLVSGYSPVYGQNEMATPAPGTPIVRGTPVTGTPVAIATPIADRGDDSGTFDTFGYDDVTVQGMQASTVMYFRLPRRSEETQGGSLDLVYSHSPLLVPELSTMTVIINGHTMTSVRLGKETQEGGRVSIPLPGVDADETSLAVRFAFHLRLTEEQCEVPDDPALWVTIHNDSAIRLASPASASAPYLSDLPSLFRSGPITDEPHPVFVLPERANAEELNAAGIVAHALGYWSGQSDNAPVVGDVSFAEPGEDTPAILVGQGDALPVGERWGDLEWDGRQFLLNGVAVSPESGVLAMRQQPVPQLLVSGGSPDGVLQAAAAVAQIHDGGGYETSAVVVSGALPTPTGSRLAWEEGAASFAQLGIDTLEVAGPGEHFIDLSFERPAEWVLREGGTLQLQIDVAPGVRLETSWVRVLVNDLDIGSQPLRLSEEGVERYVFTLPAGRLNNDLDGQPVRSLTLKIRIFLDYPDSECEAVDPLGTRASLLPTSAWFLPHDTFEGEDIGRFPQGFAGDDETPAAAIIVPDHPTAEELQSALQLAASIGRWEMVAPTPAPQLYPAAAIDDEDLMGRGLILVGGPERNALTDRADPEMLAALHPTVSTAVDASNYGVLSLGTSPWDEQHSLLIVADPGEGSTGMLTAAAALGDSDLLSEMQGQGIVVPGALMPQTLVGADPPNAAPADLAPYVIPDERPWIERIPAWQVVGTILTVTVIALLIGVVLLRWTRRGAR